MQTCKFGRRYQADRSLVTALKDMANHRLWRLIDVISYKKLIYLEKQYTYIYYMPVHFPVEIHAD